MRIAYSLPMRGAGYRLIVWGHTLGHCIAELFGVVGIVATDSDDLNLMSFLSGSYLEKVSSC